MIQYLKEVFCIHKMKTLSVVPDGVTIIETSMCEKCGLIKRVAKNVQKK